MSQVSESSASASNTLGPLQTRGSSPVRGQAEDNSGSDRVATQERAKEAQQASSAEDKVQISREAKDQDRGGRVEEGKRNVDNLRPQSERIESERGAAQKLRDLQNSNARGVRDFDEAKNQGESQNPSGNSGNSVEAKKSNQVQPPDAEKSSKIIEQQASDRKNSEVQLRDFQNKNEVKIEPQIVAESVDEIEYQREKAEAAKEPALEPPSQRIIQKGGSTGSESERSAAVNERNDAQGSRKEPPNPVSAQTQTGQNVDSLI
jgi:hypothetical protein